MKPVSHQSDYELGFNAQECLEAVKANPAGQKAMQYLREYRETQEEMANRERVRAYRRVIRENVVDPLAFELKYRGRSWFSGAVLNNEYHSRRFDNACFSIGWYNRRKKLGSRFCA